MDEAAGADKAEEKPDMARHAASVAMQMIYCRLQGGVDCESVLGELDDYLNIGEDADYRKPLSRRWQKSRPATMR